MEPQGWEAQLFALKTNKVKNTSTCTWIRLQFGKWKNTLMIITATKNKQKYQVFGNLCPRGRCLFQHQRARALQNPSAPFPYLSQVCPQDSPQPLASRKFPD